MAEVNQFGMSEAERAHREAMETIALKAQNEVQYDPAESQRILNVQGSTGLPPQLIKDNLDMLETRIKAGEFDVEQFRKEAPEFAKFVAENPRSLAALKADRENMGMIERAITPIKLGAQATYYQVKLNKLWEESKRTGVMPDPKLVEEYRSWQQPHQFGAETGFGKLFVDNVKQLGPTIEGIRMASQYGVSTALGFAGMTALAGQAGPQAALPEELVTVPFATALGLKVGGSVGMALSVKEQEGGSRMDEYMQMGMSFDTARTMSNISGSINIIPEMVGLGFIAKNTPGLDKLTATIGSKFMKDVILKKPSLGKATAAMVGRWGESLGGEIAAEIIQDSVGMVTKEYGRRKDELGGEALSFETWKRDVAETAYQTARSALLMTGAGPTMSYIADSKRVWEAKRMQGIYADVGTAAKNSEIRTKVPSAWRAFTERLGKTDTLLIDAKGFDTHFQQSGIDPDQVLKELGVDMNEVEEARQMAAGEGGEGYIEVPLSKFIDKIAPTEHHDALAMHLKANRDQMTLSEANMWEKNNPELVKNLEKLISGDESMLEGIDDKILADVTGQLVAAGHKARDAQHMAKIMLGIPNLAKRAGKDPMELYNRVFGGIKSVKEADLEKRDVDLSIDPLLNRLRNKDFPKAKAVRGVTLVDFLKKQGGLMDQGGELSAQDMQLEMPGLVSKKGMELDKAAELAAEAGYIAERDVQMLQDAVAKELRGEQVAGIGADPAAVEMDHMLNLLEEALGQAGIDIDQLSNTEIRAALAKYETMMQDGKIDLSELKALQEYVLAATFENRPPGPMDSPGMVDPRMLSLAETLLSQLSETQDFGELRIAGRVPVKGTTETVTYSGPAQTLFDRKMKERNVLKKLKDCVGG